MARIYGFFHNGPKQGMGTQPHKSLPRPWSEFIPCLCDYGLSIRVSYPASYYYVHDSDGLRWHSFGFGDFRDKLIRGGFPWNDYVGRHSRE